MAAKLNAVYTLNGRITNQKGEPLEGMTVRAFVQAPGIFPKPLGQDAATDADGAYAIGYSRQDLSIADPKSGAPEVFIRIFQADQQLGESPAVSSAQKRLTIDLMLDYVAPNPNEPSWSVRGKVQDATGEPISGLVIQAFDVALRSEKRLGESQTDKEGNYEIPYYARQLLKRSANGADLVIKAFATAEPPLAVSDVLFQAPRRAVIDLIVSREAFHPLSLFEKITRDLTPLLGDILPGALEEDPERRDLTYLAGATGYGTPILARFALAHMLAQRAVQAEFWFAILYPPFFEYAADRGMAEQYTSLLATLPALDAAALRKALASSLARREIGEGCRRYFDEWTAAFLAYAASLYLDGATGPSFVKRALEDAGIDGAEKQQKFARLFNEFQSLTPEMVDLLRRDRDFEQEQIDDLRVSFRLAELTQSDFSVVSTMKESFGIRQPDQIRALAKKGETEWMEWAYTRYKAGEIALPIEVTGVDRKQLAPAAAVYGKFLAHQLQEAFPTAAFVGGLERALNNGGARGLRQPDTILKFLDTHQGFDLLTTPVDKFLNSREIKDRVLAKDEEFGRQLKAAQRVFKLTPTFEATDTLLADNVHSAQMIYRMGETEFVRTYADKAGFTPETARRTWNRAANTHAAAVTVIADLKALENEGLPQVMKHENADLTMFPNWNNLFQTGDICDCEHCRSVISPAAYFADLLMFLKDRETHTGAGKVKDVLFRRRPDLGYLELNCDNALVPLPYIDVVCEVLERAVAGAANDSELVGFAAVPAGDAAAKAAVQTALVAAGLDLGGDFSLSQVDPADPNRWVAHGDAATYLIRKNGTPNFFAQVLPNTKVSAAEMRAYPQYVDPEAYKVLRGVRYPLALPFDLFAEEVRAVFQKSNLQRWDLMRTMRGAVAPYNLTDGEIAAEYFGISTDPVAAFDEKQLILSAEATAAGQQAVWGETGAGWLATVANVKTFLTKTGLEYNDLLVLLDLKFINPAGDMAIQHLDPSCDTDQKAIQALDAAKLDRIHRFLRLWRKLKGWKMWELDLVLCHPLIGNQSLNEPFLINLFYFSEVRKKLGAKASVEQVSALFDNLNTRTQFTTLHEKRADGLYQKLFLNRRLVQPIDPAFLLDTATGDLLAGELMTNHAPVILAALGVREADLQIYKTLVKGDGTAYITDALTLANLSFVWRHAWLAKMLKFRADDWQVVLKLLNQDIVAFGSPQAALKYLEDIDQLRLTGFTPDELNWILDADRTAKAATKEADTGRFLTGLRQQVKSIQAEFDPAQYGFLTATPPTDADSLSALLTTLLQRLGRDEAAAQFFIGVLRDEIVQELPIASLPAGFNFPATITGGPNNIPIRYEPSLSFSGQMTVAQRTILLNDASLAVVTALPAYQQAVQALFDQPGQPVTVSGLPAGFIFPGAITGAPNNIPIRYKPVLRFTGVMTAAQRAVLTGDAALAAVTGIAAYQAAVTELYSAPRAALKFFETLFTAPLSDLPDAVDFASLPDSALIQKISYDAEQRLLRFGAIMTSDDKAALDALSADILYRNAVNSLYTQPGLIAAPDPRIWLVDADLQFPLRDLNTPANDHLAVNLSVAVTRALAYLSKTLVEKAVIQLSSTQLGLTEALTARLFGSYAVVPDTVPPAPPAPINLLTHMSKVFALTNGVVEYGTRKTTFDAWFWAQRVAAIWKKWKLTLTDLERLTFLTIAAQLLDMGSLPQDAGGTIAPIDRFIRMGRLLRLRSNLPETRIELLDVLIKLNTPGTYGNAAAFALDVELVNEDWNHDDVTALVGALDLNFPNDYLLAEKWERLRRAFYFLANLNAGAARTQSFAAPAMQASHAKALRDLLRSKLGAETWESLCAEIQDVLRERKRDALTAYLLTQPQPADAPSAKWENTNDLYAYYLLDVEMNSCQLTSRLVQASGSVQLFVQRCFMGLEPDVIVQADGPTGDSAWRWWKWMRKYRVWEANRKVFLWPENWIEPELKKDRSQFFRDLENELLQNEINEYTVETAFQNYLEKLDGVAQLEIAGFYQEDDGDNAIVHVFGRTTGAEPHLYYYRRYDYRQWTPWEKIELDIQGDYLIPAVVGKRLFLFWPVFTEVPDEVSNSTVTVPAASVTEQPNKPVQKTWKRLRVQMAVSDYRRGKWSPKKVSTDYVESGAYTGDIIRKHYLFVAVDRSEIDGRFGVSFQGYSVGSDESTRAYLNGGFDIAGCGGVPEIGYFPGNFYPVVRPEVDSTGDDPTYMKWAELIDRADYQENDFTLIDTLAYYQQNSSYLLPILMQTPDLFKISPPWHLSYLDKLLMDGQMASAPTSFKTQAQRQLMLGSWLPYFYADKQRTFFVLPALARLQSRKTVSALNESDIQYYPAVKKVFRNLEDVAEAFVHDLLVGFDPSLFSADQRKQAENFLAQQFSGEPAPPYTDEQLKKLVQRFIMRFFHLYLGTLALNGYRMTHHHFKNFYHPFVCDFARKVYNPLQGIPALMSRETQMQDSGFRFLQSYQPQAAVLEAGTERYYPSEVVDFTPDGAYAPYNWELFFHAPLLVANALSRNQRFEEARDWYHFMFNPLGLESSIPGGSSMSKYWITKPFYETTDPQYVQQRIENIMRMLAGDTSVPGYSSQLKTELEGQVLDWRNYPFEPHRIANYRTVAYQKTVVMKYLDNLIAWGDYLFRQDSMESINEATQLYILAAEILGPRPKQIPPQARPHVETYNELELQLDKFSNALVEVENLVPVMPDGSDPGGDAAPLPLLYFCIPRNEKMLGYWDTVADRLYKIRNCMNIEGVVRQLALFEPPIDPAALVKAVAGGMDLGSALADMNTPLPLYRFSTMLQKAKEVCGDVRSLGAALLASLEKKDAEALALLRQSQEIRLQEAVKALREVQIDEAKENLAGLKKNKELVTIRRDFYRDVEKVSASETLQQTKLSDALTFQQIAQVVNVAASVAHIVPSFDLGISGFGGSPKAGVMFGGPNVGSGLQAAAGGFTFVANVHNYDASKAATDAGHDRRWNDWKLQEQLADKEIEQLDRSIAAAELRISIAQKELDNQTLQIENSKAIDEFMRSKYTNEELYQWHIGQISGVYFQSYRLAYDLAKATERCYRFELGIQDSSYISFGYWDSLKKGLLSGEKLQYDLHQLEAAYLGRNRREYELTKHVSLALLNPLALVQLRETGRCTVQLPEELFDLDFPGHYFRRIKSVSMTLPCVAGPYTTVACTLRLVRNCVRINTGSGDNGYPRNTDDAGLPADDLRFVETNVPVKATAVSTAQNDSGVFELNFRDERYLPFEGAGAISDWSLELFNDLPANNPDPANPDFGRPLRQFDYGTISDVIFHVRYTAREDSGPFKNGAVSHLRNYFAQDGEIPGLRMYDLRQEFPGEWYRFLHPVAPAGENIFELKMSSGLFPWRDAGATLKINRIWLLARCTDPGNYSVTMTPPLPAPPPPGSNTVTLTPNARFGGLHANGLTGKDVSAAAIQVAPTDPEVTWRIRLTRPGGGNLQQDPVRQVMEVEDLLLVLGYEWE